MVSYYRLYPFGLYQRFYHFKGHLMFTPWHLRACLYVINLLNVPNDFGHRPTPYLLPRDYFRLTLRLHHFMNNMDLTLVLGQQQISIL